MKHWDITYKFYESLPPRQDPDERIYHLRSLLHKLDVGQEHISLDLSPEYCLIGPQISFYILN